MIEKRGVKANIRMMFGVLKYRKNVINSNKISNDQGIIPEGAQHGTANSIFHQLLIIPV